MWCCGDGAGSSEFSFESGPLFVTLFIFFSCRDCCGDGSGSSEFSFESGSFLLAPWQGGENSLKSNSEVGEMFLWSRTVSYQSDQSKSISPLSGERVARYSRSLCSSCSSQIPLGNSSCWRLRRFHVLATSTRNLDYISLKWQDFFII